MGDLGCEIFCFIVGVEHNFVFRYVGSYVGGNLLVEAVEYLVGVLVVGLVVGEMLMLDGFEIFFVYDLFL